MLSDVKFGSFGLSMTLITNIVVFLELSIIRLVSIDRLPILSVSLRLLLKLPYRVFDGADHEYYLFVSLFIRIGPMKR